MKSPRHIVLGIVLLTGLAHPAWSQVCTPQLRGTLSASGSLAAPVVLGSTAYFPAGNAGLVWIDVTDPDNPELSGSLDTQGQGMAVVLEFFDGYLVMADGSAGLIVFTLSGDGTPTQAATGGVGGSALSLAGGSGVYTVGTQEGSLVTVTLGEGFVPQVQGSVSVGGPVRDQVQSLSTVYCAAGSAGLVTVDVSDRENPVVSATYDLGGTVRSLAKDGNILYAGVEGVGLVALQMEASGLVTLASLTTPATPTDIAAWGGRVYLAMSDWGILAVDSSLGQALLQLGELSLTGASGLAQAGDLLYVGRGTQGFAAVDVSSCATAGVTLSTLYVPAAARATGSANTYWVTDLAMANMTASPATLNIAYLVKNQGNPAPANESVVLQPGEQMLLEDVFSSLFDLTSANGGLRVITSHPDVKVTSRTYNAAGAEGTYGQFIPALDVSAAVVPGVPAGLPQLQQNDGFRTNIGLVNITPLDITAEVDLYLGTGNLLGPVTVDLEPYEMVQLDRVFTSVGAGSVDNGYAVVRVLTSGGKVLAYASVVDNGSGDPIYVPAQLLLPGSPFE